MTRADVELLRMALKSVSPHYPGFNNEAMLKNIDELCDMAIKSLNKDNNEHK